jgi:hypothetical protein
MDRNEKKRLRERIGEHLDVSGTRLTDGEATFLGQFIDEYDEMHQGRTETRQHSYDGWSSDGKYTRTTMSTHTFTDEIGIRQDSSYVDDDGQTENSSRMIKDARGVLNWFRDRS